VRDILSATPKTTALSGSATAGGVVAGSMAEPAVNALNMALGQGQPR
jgi:hypothetical protein